MRPQRVALLINDSDDPHASWVVISRNLAAELGRQGVEAVVVRARGSLRQPFFSRREGTAYYSVGLLYMPLHRVLCALQLAWIFRRERVDLVHVHGIGRDFWGFRLYRRFSRMPFVFTCHTRRPGVRGGRPFSPDDLRFLVSRAGRVTSVSRAAAESLRESFPSAGGKLRVVYNGTSPAARDRPADPPSSEPFILSVGTLGFHKGMDVLLFALCDLLRRGASGLRVAVCGEDPTGLAADLVSRLGLGASVRLLGPTPHERVRALMRECLFFVSASREESFGMAILEAMASGKAVAAPRVGGVPEFVEDGVSGLLYAPGDAAALADAIERLHRSAELRERLGREAARAASGLTWADSARGYKDLYGEVLQMEGR